VAYARAEEKAARAARSLARSPAGAAVGVPQALNDVRPVRRADLRERVAQYGPRVRRWDARTGRDALGLVPSRYNISPSQSIPVILDPVEPRGRDGPNGDGRTHRGKADLMPRHSLKPISAVCLSPRSLPPACALPWPRQAIAGPLD
jgi:hypothetical protein